MAGLTTAQGVAIILALPIVWAIGWAIFAIWFDKHETGDDK